jgi:prevent-host-death family protein
MLDSPLDLQETRNMKQYTSEDARREWRRILNEVGRGEQVEITRYGELTAVVVPAEWRDHTRSALRAFSNSDDPPVSAREMRQHVVTLIGLLDGMHKIAFTPEGRFRSYWEQLNSAVDALAGLLPENAEG